jgi:hypothetical protein
MLKYWNTVLNERGEPRSEASVTVQQSGVNSSLFSDQAGLEAKTNPLTTDSKGFFEFYADPGEYDLFISGTGFDDYSIPDGASLGITTAADVSFTQSGIPTISHRASRTVGAKLSEVCISVRDALNSSGSQVAGDGVTDDASGIQRVIDAVTANGGGVVFFPRGTYLIGSQLTVADDSYVHLMGEGYGSVIKKGFNGAMVSLGLKGEMSEVRLDGAGATRTGRGVIISTGNGGDGWQNIHDCTILDTESYCIEYTASGAGWMSRIVNNRMDTYNRATFCVKYPDTDNNGPRKLLGNVCLGPLADLAASAGVAVVCNEAGENVAQNIPSVQIADDAVRPLVVGNTFECLTSITIKGDEGVWTDNIMRAGYTVASGAASNRIANNSGAASTLFDTDNSGGATNEIFGVLHTYTPVITQSGSNPTAGLATLTGSYQRKGLTVTLRISATIDDISKFGTGTIIISLPAGIPAPTVDTIGSARFFDSGTIIRTGICYVASTGISLEADSSTGGASPTVPFTWANGDSFHLAVDYALT